MKFIKYIALFLILFNIPTFSLENFGASFGSFSSALLFASIIGFFIVSKKTKPATPFIILGISFFVFSGLNYTGITTDYIKDFIRFFIFILCVNQLTKETSNKELLLFLVIGGLSILINATVFSNVFGRYGGFYLNPNKAGFICLFGFALTYTLKNYKFKLAIQLLLVICGILTLSRSFILFLVIISIISLFADKKNVQTMLIGAIAFIVILTASSLQLNKARFSALQSIFSSDAVNTQTITEGSRDETWAEYANLIYDNVIVGAGYKSMRGSSGLASVEYGVHNTFLLVLGEAGIISFLIIVFIYLSLLIKSIRCLSLHQEYTYLTIAIIGYLMVAHNYFDKYDVLFVSIWLYNHLNNSLELENEKKEEE